MVAPLDGGLAVDVELAQGLEGVVEELEADGVGGIGGEEVENTTATRKLETGVDLGDFFEILSQELGFQIGGFEGQIGVKFEGRLAKGVSLWGGRGPSGGGKEDGGVLGIRSELVKGELPIAAGADVGFVLEFGSGNDDGRGAREGGELLFQLVALSWVRDFDPEP